MILFTENSGNGKLICNDKKQIIDCMGPGRGVAGEGDNENISS